MNNPAISVEHLSKRYVLGQIHGPQMMLDACISAIKRKFGGESVERSVLWALKDVSFSVNAGEVVGIIGRNGAGKSTLLKVLSRITYPTAGNVRVNGRVASLLEVGTGFHEDLTGRENVFLNGSILGMRRKEIEAKLDQIVEFAGVDKFLDTPIKRYSSGMRLRLGFAVAAHLDPDLLIVDEVLAVGDSEFQKKCLNKMQDLRGGGRTVLFVSHNLSAVENLCSRSIWIDGGRIRMDSDTNTVIKSYLSSAAASNDQSGMDLTNIPSRMGNGLARFTAVQFLDKDRQPMKYLYSGCAVVIRSHFQVFEQVHNLMVGVEITSDLGTRVAASNSWVSDFSIPTVYPGKGYLDWEIDFLNLQPGRYNLSLWLGPWESQHDILQHCVLMDIETSDYYKTGRGIESRWGLVFLPGRWTSDQLPTSPEAILPEAEPLF